MNLDDAVVLETFSNRIEAEMATGLLESEGVEAMVMARDTPGDLPHAPASSRGVPHGLQRGRGRARKS